MRPGGATMAKVYVVEPLEEIGIEEHGKKYMTGYCKAWA
jgi:hypothetical protein